jgi:predicted nucleotide-binding protein
MPKTPTPQEPTPETELRKTRDEAREGIVARIQLGEDLHSRVITNVDQLTAAEKEYQRWDTYNGEMLKQLFTTRMFEEEYSWWSGVFTFGRDELSPHEKLKAHKEHIREKIHRLESVLDRVELIPLADEMPHKATVVVAKERTNKVFVVHGHDDAARESVARFLERLGLEAIILHEQATGGRTIIEKLEHYADVDFATVLLTPDDIGGVRTSEANKLQPRARQNVILELGFFVGKLGRDKVCALHQGPLELPTDYLGVCYVRLDDGGGWRLSLVKELREAGFSVDLNLAL